MSTAGRLRGPVRLVVAFVLAGTLVACGSDDDGSTSESDETGTPTASTVSASDLEGSVYESTSVEGHDLVEGTTVQIDFEDGNMAVSAGCNTLFGPYGVSDGVLMWTGPAASSMMACDDDLTAQDAWLTDLFTQGADVSLDGATLTLESGELTMVLESSDGNSLDELLGKTWTLRGTTSGSRTVPVPEGVRTPRLEVGQNGLARLDTGCNTGRTTVKVDADADTITFGPAAITRVGCRGPARRLEQAVLAVADGTSDRVEWIGNVLIVTKGDNALVFEVG